MTSKQTTAVPLTKREDPAAQPDKSSVTHDTCAFIEPLTREERGEQGKSKHEDLEAGQLKRNYSAQPYGKANSFAATKMKYSYDVKNHSKVSTDYGSPSI